MASIVVINGGDKVGASRADINSNFENLNTGKADAADISNIDNTSDADKPVSTAQQAALDAKLALSGGTMSGDVNMGDNNISNVDGLTVNGSVVCPYHQITYAASITPDFNDGTDQYIILTGDVTINAPANATAGSRMVLYIYQDANGSRLATLNAIYKTAGGAGLTLSTDESAKDIITLLVDKDGNVDLVKQGDSK